MLRGKLLIHPIPEFCNDLLLDCRLYFQMNHFLGYDCASGHVAHTVNHLKTIEFDSAAKFGLTPPFPAPSSLIFSKSSSDFNSPNCFFCAKKDSSRFFCSSSTSEITKSSMLGMMMAGGKGGPMTSPGWSWRGPGCGGNQRSSGLLQRTSFPDCKSYNKGIQSCWLRIYNSEYTKLLRCHEFLPVGQSEREGWRLLWLFTTGHGGPRARPIADEVEVVKTFVSESAFVSCPTLSLASLVSERWYQFLQWFLLWNCWVMVSDTGIKASSQLFRWHILTSMWSDLLMLGSVCLFVCVCVDKQLLMLPVRQPASAPQLFLYWFIISLTNISTYRKAIYNLVWLEEYLQQISQNRETRTVSDLLRCGG